MDPLHPPHFIDRIGVEDYLSIWKVISVWIFHQNPFDGKYLQSFTDLFLRVFAEMEIENLLLTEYLGYR